MWAAANSRSHAEATGVLTMPILIQNQIPILCCCCCCHTRTTTRQSLRTMISLGTACVTVQKQETPSWNVRLTGGKGACEGSVVGESRAERASL